MLGLLPVFLKIYTDAADHFPLILISFFREEFLSQNTPFLPAEAWSALEDVAVGMKSELFLRLKSCVESDSPRLGKKPKPMRIPFSLVRFGWVLIFNFFYTVFIL